MKVEVVRSFEEQGRTMVLRRRGEVLELVLAPGPVLLSSAALETELAFGRLAAAGRGDRPAAVLVGGLGFAATVRGALEMIGAEGTVTVVEKLRAVIDLARSDARHLVGGTLDDPRVTVTEGDVAEALASARDLSAILLDVDNGPDWATFRSNARLYADHVLTQAHDALRPGGLFAVWSGYPADAFLQRLRRVGFHVRAVPLVERGAIRARAYVGVRAS